MKRLRVRVRASFQSMPHCTYTHTMSDVHESRQHDTTCCVKCCARKYQGRSALASQHPQFSKLGAMLSAESNSLQPSTSWRQKPARGRTGTATRCLLDCPWLRSVYHLDSRRAARLTTAWAHLRNTGHTAAPSPLPTPRPSRAESTSAHRHFQAAFGSCQLGP